MWLMLQPDEPDDYVVATAEMHSVRDFVEIAFGYAGLDYREYVVIDPSLYRPAEVDILRGNPAKARARLGWSSQVPLRSLICEMVDADCRAAGVEPAREPVKASNRHA